MEPDLQSARDLALLRRFEPVIRYTQGELFLPASVEDYVRGARLMRRSAKGDPDVLADSGTLTLEALAVAGREHSGEPLYLSLVDEPLDRRQFKAWKKDPERPNFVASSRFAAVGILSRLIDSVMRLTLVLRGRVPGGYAAAAALRMRSLTSGHGHPYYGQVRRDGGYIVLQYWYFYAMNDWRSTFGGVNDHEADWEQVTLFLTDRPGGEPELTWVAFSSHDEVGDDLRRRADDPDIEYVGEHPVVYAGAGSHSGAYLPGEYVVSVPAPLPGFIDRARRALLRILPWTDPEAPGIGIPYIDYRRGDGPAVGAGEDRQWQAVLIDDHVPWVREFRGLWGLDTKDPLGGERAPAGPRYDRGQTVRESWGQPVAWAGLDKVPPTEGDLGACARRERRHLIESYSTTCRELEAAREVLRASYAEDRALGRTDRRPSKDVVAAQVEVHRLRRQQADLLTRIESLDGALGGPIPQPPVHSHLKHRAAPLVDTGSTEGRRGRLLRLWSAASASILLAAFGVILLVPDWPIFGPVLILIGVMVVVEAALRGKLLRLLGAALVAVLIAVAVLAVIGLFLGQFRLALGLLLAIAAIYMLWQTLSESVRTR